jgi:hypothetical protein
MKRNRSFLRSLLFALLAVGLIAPAAQSAAQPTVILDGSGTNATGIQNLAYDGLVYNVTFVEDDLSVIYGDPPEFDFEAGADGARDSVLSALNSVPEVRTVGPSTLSEFHIPIGTPEPWYTSAGEYLSGDWFSGATNHVSLGTSRTWAKFTVVDVCSVDADCDDGNFCTGSETCSDGLCQDGPLPCARVCLEDVDQCVASAPPATVILDGSGTNATAIQYLAYDGLLYNVGFVGAAPGSDSVYGTPPELDFTYDDVEGVIGAVNAELNATPATTVGPTSGSPQNMYSIAYDYNDANRSLSTWGGEWFSNSSNWAEGAIGSTSLTFANDIWAVFTVASGPVGCSANAECDDGDFCTGSETCNDGECQDGPLPCAEGDVCYEDVDQCVEVQCTSDADCDNGVFCDGMGACDAGQCVAGTPPCDAEEVCVEEVDQCVEPECTVDADCANELFCDGEKTCVLGQCQDGTSPCETGQVCVEETDECVEPECIINAECDNGAFCDGLEACDRGQCVAGTPPCAEGETCSEGSNDAECVAPECTINSDCDDGDFCTGSETCSTGQCQDGIRPCGAGEICIEEEDRCDTVDCVNDAQCDDGRFCNGMETCSAGQCQDGTTPCTEGETCDETSNECVDPQCTSDPDCDDRFFCTGEETCVEGQCQDGTPPSCGEGICVEILDRCVDPECTEDAQCENGSFCDGLATCEAGRCQDGTSACGAEEICVEIIDQCVDPECTNDAACDDDRFCDGMETCEAGQCQPTSTSPCALADTCDEEGDQCVGSGGMGGNGGDGGMGGSGGTAGSGGTSGGDSGGCDCAIPGQSQPMDAGFLFLVGLLLFRRMKRR